MYISVECENAHFYQKNISKFDLIDYFYIIDCLIRMLISFCFVFNLKLRNSIKKSKKRSGKAFLVQKALKFRFDLIARLTFSSLLFQWLRHRNSIFKNNIIYDYYDDDDETWARRKNVSNIFPMSKNKLRILI